MKEHNYYCPKCNQKITSEESLLNKFIQCPTCLNHFLVLPKESSYKIYNNSFDMFIYSFIFSVLSGFIFFVSIGHIDIVAVIFVCLFGIGILFFLISIFMILYCFLNYMKTKLNYMYNIQQLLNKKG